MITADSITAAARKLTADLALATSCAPNPDAPQLTEADYNAIGAELAKLMGSCASYLEDAGFDTAGAQELAEEAEAEYARLAKTRIQQCPGCGVMPGEGMDEDCTGDLECGNGEPNARIQAHRDAPDYKAMVDCCRFTQKGASS